VHIDHVAVWVRDLELVRAFYTEFFGAVSSELYVNPASGFRSYFVALGEGTRLELMHRPGVGPAPTDPATGYAHVAIALGSRNAVAATVADLRRRGVSIAAEPRVTGDGYYEAVVLDPEGNRIELVAAPGRWQWRSSLSPYHRYLTAVACIAALTASTVAFSHMTSLPSFIVIAPGYVVQAWLFERHSALGGVGYGATMIGVSALFWTLILMIAARLALHVVHRLTRR
jgi:lactoylglutathione lyase